MLREAKSFLPNYLTYFTRLLRKPGLLVWPVLALLLIWALRSAPWEEIRAALTHLNPASIVTLMGLNALILVMFAARWRLILRAQGLRAPLLDLLRYRLAAFSLSYFTPGPQFGGEPLQVYALHSRHPVPASSAVSSVTLDKLFELLANFAFLVFGVLVVLQSRLLPNLSPERALPVALALLAAPLVYLGALAAGRRPLARLASASIGINARFTRKTGASGLSRRLFLDAETFADAERQAGEFFRRRPGAVLGAMALSALTWGVMVFEYWLTLNFLGYTLSLEQTIAALTAARLAFLMPMPGGLGALEASQALAMSALGFGPAAGLSLALLIRARDLSFGALGLLLAGSLTSARCSPVAPAGD